MHSRDTRNNIEAERCLTPRKVSDTHPYYWVSARQIAGMLKPSCW